MEFSNLGISVARA